MWFSVVLAVGIHLVAAEVCPGGETTCSSRMTCCELPSGEQGCCPFANATCCPDKVHCCPYEYDCLDDHCLHHFKGAEIMVNYQELPKKMYSASRPASNNSVLVKSLEPVKQIPVNTICPGGRITCPAGNTCCPRRLGQWACCPLLAATCCADQTHCCPHDHICTDAGTCIPAGNSLEPSKEMAGNSLQPAKEITVNTVCPGSRITCPAGNTCCPRRLGQWACCPLLAATCCADQTHCCPHDHICTDAGTCIPVGDSLEPVKQIGVNTICPGGRETCPAGNTCCPRGYGHWSCCPLLAATCCADQTHCCPHGYHCTGAGTCVRVSK